MYLRPNQVNVVKDWKCHQRTIPFKSMFQKVQVDSCPKISHRFRSSEGTPLWLKGETVVYPR